MTEDTLPAAQEKQFHDYFRILVRRRRILLLIFCLILIGTIVYTYQLTPIYEAVTILRVKDDAGKGTLSLGRELSGPRNNIETEIQILRSMTNAEQTAQLLHLTRQIAETSKGFTFTITEFETPNTWAPYSVELISADSYVVKDKDGNRIGMGKNNVPMQVDKFRLCITNIKGKLGDSFQLSLQSIDDVAGGIIDSTSASQIGTDTGIIRLSVRHPNPSRARDITNTLAQVYTEQNVFFKGEEARKSIEFIAEQMKLTHAALEEAENRVQQFKASAHVYDLGMDTKSLVDQLVGIDKQKASFSLQKKMIEQSRSSLRQTMSTGKVLLPSVMKEDENMSGSLADKITDLEIQKKILRLEKSEEHPSVRAIQTQIDEIMLKLRSSYETTLKEMSTQERELDRQVSTLEAKLNQLPDVERQLANLTRVATVNVNIYTYLLQKHEEFRIAKAALVSNIQVIDVAKLPRASVYPNRKKNILLGVLIGLFVGGALAFFVDYLDDTIKDGEEVRYKLGMPILATIPFITLDTSPDDNSPAILSHRSPKNAIAEAFRSLRTSVHFSAISNAKKVILITSSFPGEGKTTIISNLAATLSQAGSRVLLIDCDMRRPSLHKLFNQSKVPGLSEILAGDTAADAIVETAVPGLSFIPAGTSPPNPSELLSSRQFEELLELYKTMYDHILLDAPPVLAVTDAPLLTAIADIMILVLETERVPVKTALRTMEMLDMVKAPIAGVVLNDKTGQAERYGYYGHKYYSYSYGYGYSYYGEKDDTKKESRKGWKRFLRKV